MPELPEVEIARRNLERWLARRKIVRAEFASSPVVRRARPGSLARLVTGRTVERVERKGKWLRLVLSGGAQLFSHLGMTGKWVERPRDDAPARFERARLETARSSVRYTDPRLFGRLIALPKDATWPAWEELGPDPLNDGIEIDRLIERQKKIKRSIKETLMDQGVIAGVGNIQAAEALWRAKIDPRTPANAIDVRRARGLARAIRSSIDDTIRRETSPEITYVEEPGAENPFDVYGKAGEKCPRCREMIARFVQGGRSTFYCPRCQR